MDPTSVAESASGDDMDIPGIFPSDFVTHIKPCTILDESQPLKTLVLDCRPFLVFNSSHILTAYNSMVAPIVKRRCRGVVALSTVLRCEDQRHRLTSGFYDLVVVYDEDTEELNKASSHSNLAIVLRSLQCHLEGGKLRFLKGGFSKFLEAYPDLCVSQCSLQRGLEATVRISKDETYAKQVEVGGPAEVLPYLFLGDSRHAGQKDLLKDLGVTAIVNVSKTCANHFPDDFVYKTIPVDDKTDSELAPWFNETINFIDTQRDCGGKVLVHCQAGVSRSATICVAYIMYKRKCPMNEAFDRVQKQRGVISPNLSFMRQLQNFERNLQIRETTLASPARPLLSPCRLSSNAFWGGSNNQATDEGYSWILSANSRVSPLLSPTTPFFPSPLLSPT